MNKYFKLIFYLSVSLFISYKGIQAQSAEKLENQKQQKVLADDEKEIERSRLLNIFLFVTSCGVTFTLIVIFYNRKKLKTAYKLLEINKDEINFQKEKLNESEIRLKTAQQIAHIGNWEWNVLSDNLSYSDELLNIYDLVDVKENLNFKTLILDRVHPQDKARITEYFYSFKNISPIEKLEYRIVKSNNEERWLRAKVLLIEDGKDNIIKVSGTVQDFTDNKKAELEKIEIIMQQNFTQQLIESQEVERKRIAAELHDGIGQEMLIIKNHALLALQKDVKTDFIKEHVNEISNTASKLLSEIRLITYNLRPYHLEKLGLSETIEIAIENISKSISIELRFNIDPIDNCLQKEDEIIFFRIIQEAINNIIKHSKAKKALINISKEEKNIIVNIKDDGIGFSLAEKNFSEKGFHGFGLASIAQRVKLLKGNYSIDTEPNKGTKIKIVIPVE